MIGRTPGISPPGTPPGRPAVRSGERRGNPLWAALLVALLAGGAYACDEDPPRVQHPGLGLGGGSEKADSDERGTEAQADAKPEEGRGDLALDDEDFVESELNRDPFRSFVTLFEVKTPDAPQRSVIMPNTAIEEMRLIAIITRVPRPKAMLVDPLGVGHVVERGDYVGRPDVVRAGGLDEVAVTLNWRVERIRSNELVLMRESPAKDEPPTRRVIPLREESYAAQL